MSHGHHTKERRERRHRDDRYHDPRDAYPTTARAAYPEDYYPQEHVKVYPRDYPSEYHAPPPESEPPTYEPDYKPRRSGRGNPPPFRRRGLNEDYYNVAPAPASDEYEKPRRSRRDRHDRHDRHARRSEERYDSRRYGRPTETEDEADHYQRKSHRRSKTEPRSYEQARTNRRYDDYSDDERYGYDTQPEDYPERPSKPKRSRSFLEKIGIGKSDNHPEYGRDDHRGRSPVRSPSRGRKAHRAYSYSPSPPRRRHSMRQGRAKSTGEGLRRSNTNWQRAAGSAMRAGASAAFELRNDPSPWMGTKGVRVATAALGAAMMDQMMEESHQKSRGGGGGVRQRAVGKLGEVALAHLVSSGSSKSRDRSRKRY